MQFGNGGVDARKKAEPCPCTQHPAPNNSIYPPTASCSTTHLTNPQVLEDPEFRVFLEDSFKITLNLRNKVCAAARV